mgnify:FL=1
MKNLEGKKININGNEYIIKDDSRKGSGSIGWGSVGLEDKHGEYFVESGCYFYDTKPYFNQKAFDLDH